MEKYRLESAAMSDPGPVEVTGQPGADVPPATNDEMRARQGK